MPHVKSKTKLSHHKRPALRMLLPLVALSVATGIVLVVSSFASAVYPSGYVNGLYVQAFGRTVDSSGASYWQGQFRSNGCNSGSLASAARVIYGSSEFSGKLYNNNEVVLRIYRGALQREPDSGGYAFWVGKLNTGSSRSSVAQGIINGAAAEFNSRIAPNACAVPPASTPAAPATPSKPATTPKKTTTSTSRSTASTAKPATPAASAPAAASPGDSSAPSVPANFAASNDNASSSVKLSWDASTDDAGVAGYKLQRSTNGTDWDTVADTIATNNYSDRTVGFKTKYTYRVQAFDAAGNASEYATTDIETGTFSANASSDSGNSIASGDNIVIANLPTGAVPENSECTISDDTDNITDLHGLTPKSFTLVGPYLMTCKNADGDTLTSFNKPVVLTVAPPAAKTKGYAKFRIFTYDMQEQKWQLAKSVYNKKTKNYQVEIAGPAQVALVGDKAPNYLPLFLSFFIPVALIGGGLFFYYQQKLKKQQYTDYIKKKYYNL